MVSESSVEKKQKANLGRNDSSSSSSTDENDFRRPVHKKFHLFGRHKSLHAALGGGKRTFPQLLINSCESCPLLSFQFQWSFKV